MLLLLLSIFTKQSPNTRAGNTTCRVDTRSPTTDGQLRHRCANDALGSGQPLDDATALDQQEASDTNRLPHRAHRLSGISQLFPVIRGMPLFAWQSLRMEGVGGGVVEKARG